MPNLSVSIPHQFDREEARKRVQDGIAQYRQQYGGTLGHLDERWHGDRMDFTFFALGMPITGQAFVEERAVRFEVALPGMLAALAGSIKQSIEQQGRKMLAAPR